MKKTYKSGSFEYKVIEFEVKHWGGYRNLPYALRIIAEENPKKSIGKYVVITNFLDNNFSGELLIPSQIDGINVKELGKHSFVDCELTSLVFPSSIVIVDAQAFVNCIKLEKVSLIETKLLLPKGLNSDELREWTNTFNEGGYLNRLYFTGTNIKHLNFQDLTQNYFNYKHLLPESLERITFPKNPHRMEIEINSYGVLELPNLKELVFPNLEIKLTIDGDVFLKSEKLESVVLPYNTILYDEPFNSSVILDNIKDVKQMPILGATSARWFHQNTVNFVSPANETIIGEKSFMGFDSLKNVLIKQHTKTVKYKAFSGCLNLETVEVESELTNFYRSVFDNSNNIKLISLPSLNFLANNYCFFIPNARFTFKNNSKEINLSRNVEPLDFFGAVIRRNASNVYNIFNEEKAFEGFSINTKKYVAIFNEILDKDYSNMVQTLADNNKIHKNRINEYIDYAKSVNANNSLLVLMQWKNENVDLEKERKKARKKAIAIMSDPDALLRQNFRFRGLDGNSLSIIYKGNDSIVNVPKTYKKRTIRYINKNSFIENKNILEVSLPPMIQEIGDSAFRDCTNLKSINFPKYLKFIDDNAFNGCQSLENIEFNENLEHIGNFAFSYCTSLKELIIPNKVNSIFRYTFANTLIEKVVFPEDAPDVRVGIFANCRNLKSVIFPKNINRIQRRMFIECSSLETLEIPKSVTKILTQSFMYCTNLEDVVIPASVTQIGHDAFEGCSSVKFVVEEGSYAHSFAQENNIKFVIGN